MYTALLLFGLLACVHCQARNADLDPILQLVSRSHAGSINKRHVGTPSSLDSGASSKSGSESCTMPDGKIGKCVPYYLCSVPTIVTDDTGIMDNRESVCSSYIDVCCLMPDEGAPENPTTPKPTQA